MQQNRTFIQTATGINLVVEAGAGTGKTTALINRLCMCVLVQGIAVEKLVALTFTEKAAAEIKTRFLFKLQALVAWLRDTSADKEEESEEKKMLDFIHAHFAVKDADLLIRAEEALARLDRASIGTIHGFCAEILKVFPLEAGLSPSAIIDKGAQSIPLFEQRWNRFLDEQLSENSPQADAWKEVLGEVSLADLKEFTQQLCSGKIEKYDYAAATDLLIPLCYAKISRAQALATHYLVGTKKPRKIEKKLSFCVLSLQRSIAYLEGKNPPPLTQEDPAPDNKVPCPKDWEEADFNEAVSILRFAAELTPEKQHIFQTAYGLVKEISQEIRSDYQQAGILTFDDLIVKTRNLLRDHLDVRRLLKEKYDALFIDEFQDTDPVQGEMMLFLAEEKQSSATRWQDVKLEKGKLFVVGDPKQSIYRFRGADITAYTLFTDLILAQGGKKCFLQNNFRSFPEIISTANTVCACAMVAQTGFQPNYVPIFTSNPQKHDGAVEWLFLTSPTEKIPTAEVFRHNQAEQIARWIRQHVGQMNLEKGGKLSYKHIAILMYAGTQFSFYTAALRRYGIPFTIERDKDFFRKQEMDDFFNFLQAVADPHNKIALAGVLRSPLGGLTDEELFQLAQCGELSIGAKTKNRKAQACYRLIDKFARLSGRVSIYELVQTILEDTFLPEVCALAYEGERTLTRLRGLLKLMEPDKMQNVSSAASFFLHLREEVAKHPDLISMTDAQEAADCVSLLTVHKSKGLEFPVVILADLTKQDRNTSSSNSHIFSWQYNMHGFCLGTLRDLNMVFLEEEQKKHERCESVRLLYVALTRAREKLLLVGDERTRGQEGGKPFAQVGLFPSVTDKSVGKNVKIPVRFFQAFPPEQFRFTQHVSSEESLSVTGLEDWQQHYQDRKQAYEHLQRTSQKQTPSTLTEESLLTTQQQAAAQLGTLCHRVLEFLLTQKQTDLTTAVHAITALTNTQAREKEVLSILEPFVQSALFAQIRQAHLLACELPFSFSTEQGYVMSGLIDVLLEQADGSLWVVDYKTDKISIGKENEVFDKKYRAQLTCYHEAVQKLFPQRKVRTSAVFLRTFAAVDL